MRISDWSSDVCSSDLRAAGKRLQFGVGVAVERATAQLAADMRDVDSGVIAVVLARAALACDVCVDSARPAVAQDARFEAIERCAPVPVQPRRTEQRHGGKGRVRLCRIRWSRRREKKNTKQ